MRVAIIGAGVLGASLAYALTRRGADVTVIDASGPASGATGASFGWINASFYHDGAHFALRAEGIEAYRRLMRDLKLPVVWLGALCWEEAGDALDQQAKELLELGYTAEIVAGAALARMEPHVALPDRAVFFKAEAAAEPEELTRKLLMASGAKQLFRCWVSEIMETGGKVTGVRLPGGVLAVDAVVVAAGVVSPQLLAPFGVALPMLQRPGVIFRTHPLPPTLNHICVAPIGEFRQMPDGAIVMPTAAAHQADDTEEITERPDLLADGALARLQVLLPDVALRWQQVAMAERPVPQDGLPVVGACGPEGLYTAVMHSGVTLAPVVAEILSAEVMGKGLSNVQSALIAPYRSGRFAG